MKIYLHEQGVVLAGKGWEIVEKLKEYQKLYSTVAEWVSKVDTAGMINQKNREDSEAEIDKGMVGVVAKDGDFSAYRPRRF